MKNIKYHNKRKNPRFLTKKRRKFQLYNGGSKKKRRKKKTSKSNTNYLRGDGTSRPRSTSSRRLMPLRSDLDKCLEKHPYRITTIEEINKLGKCLLTLKRIDTGTPFFPEEDILPFVNASDETNLEEMKQTLTRLIMDYENHAANTLGHFGVRTPKGKTILSHPEWRMKNFNSDRKSLGIA